MMSIEQQQPHQLQLQQQQLTTTTTTSEFDKAKPVDSSSRSSSSGEEGFVSGGSLPEESFDRLAMQISSFGISQNKAYASYLEKPIEEFANSLLSSDRLSEDALMAALPQSQFSTTTTRYNNSIGGPLSNTTNLGPHYQHRNPSSGTTGFSTSLTSAMMANHHHHHQQQQQQQQQQLPGAWFYEIGPLDEPGSGSASTGIPGDCSPLMEMMIDERLAHRHTTESVEVPSSEHVAEIVGRQGCKIKALRAKTSTYIRSPPRGEEPVFVITGQPQDVMEAKREIELAAEHFTQIRASRRHSQGGVPAPGHVTAYVRVPLRVVGLVVGPKGATIKRIQQESHTYIVTPSREREPIFEVTGLPHNVETARREIEQHIYQRTGNMPITNPSASMQSYEMAALAASNVSHMGGYSTLAQQQQQQQQQMRSMTGGYGNDYCNIENAYRAGLRSGIKTYSSSGSPTPGGFYGATDLLSQQQQSQMGNLRSMVNNENLYHPSQQMGATTNWQGQPQPQSCARMMPSFNENSLFSDFMPTQRANSFGSTNNYLSNSTNTTTTNNNNNNTTTSYLSSLSSAHSRDEGLGDSPTSTFGKFNPDAYHMLSSIWGDVDTAGSRDTTVETGLAPQIATA